MRLPLTANEDQPGPIGRRQTWTGGDCDQSVAICVPWITPSRSGPRKPGHSAGFVGTGAGAGAAVSPARAAGPFPLSSPPPAALRLRASPADRPEALVPTRPAEQQPPEDDDQPEEGGPQHPIEGVSGIEDRGDISDQDEHRCGDAGP